MASSRGFLRRMADQGGFTLLEVLAAMSVLAIGLIVLLQTDALNADRTLHSSRLIDATQVARENMDGVFSAGGASLGPGTFESEEGIFKINKTVALSEYPGVYQVKLAVGWLEGGRKRSYEVVAYLAE